jgi:hypothetical protein
VRLFDCRVPPHFSLAMTYSEHVDYVVNVVMRSESTVCCGLSLCVCVGVSLSVCGSAGVCLFCVVLSPSLSLSFIADVVRQFISGSVMGDIRFWDTRVSSSLSTVIAHSTCFSLSVCLYVCACSVSAHFPPSLSPSLSVPFVDFCRQRVKCVHWSRTHALLLLPPGLRTRPSRCDRERDIERETETAISAIKRNGEREIATMVF